MKISSIRKASATLLRKGKSTEDGRKYQDGSPEDELHEAGDGDLLAQLALIGNQRRLRVQLRCVLGAQRVVGVQVAMIEGVQHLSQPRVGAALQHLGLQRAVPELSSRDKA